MASNMDTSLFEGIEDEAVGLNRNPKIGPGSYVVELQATSVHTSEAPGRKGRKYGIVEAKVLEASEGSETPVGTLGTITLNSQGPTFLKDVKSLMLSAAGLTGDKALEEAKKIDAKKAATFFSADVQNTLKGKKVRVRLASEKAKSTGNTYLKKQFSAV